MAKPRVREGEIVQVVFWDHAEGSDDVLRFEVFGRVVKVGKRHYTIDSWGYADGQAVDRESERDNLKTFNILKSAVDSAVVLVPRDA